MINVKNPQRTAMALGCMCNDVFFMGRVEDFSEMTLYRIFETG